MDKQSEETKQRTDKQKLAIGVIVLIVLAVLGIVFHVTDDSPPVAQEFFEDRKAPEEYHEYKKEEMSNKEKAERNIFLQD